MPCGQLVGLEFDFFLAAIQNEFPDFFGSSIDYLCFSVEFVNETQFYWMAFLQNHALMTVVN